jgi:hypothetical protein
VADEQSLRRNVANGTKQKWEELVIHRNQEVVRLFNVSHLADLPGLVRQRSGSWTWLSRNMGEHRGQDRSNT